MNLHIFHIQILLILLLNHYLLYLNLFLMKILLNNNVNQNLSSLLLLKIINIKLYDHYVHLFLLF